MQYTKSLSMNKASKKKHRRQCQSCLSRLPESPRPPVSLISHVFVSLLSVMSLLSSLSLLKIEMKSKSWGKICLYRHYRWQCKMFASGVNFSREQHILWHRWPEILKYTHIFVFFSKNCWTSSFLTNKCPNYWYVCIYAIMSAWKNAHFLSRYERFCEKNEVLEVMIRCTRIAASIVLYSKWFQSFTAVYEELFREELKRIVSFSLGIFPK